MKIRYVTLLAAIAGLMAACGNDRKVEPGPSLKEAASGKFLMGVALNVRQAAGQDTYASKVVKRHFNSIVAENCMKCEVIHPEEDRFDFTEAGCTLRLISRKKEIYARSRPIQWLHSIHPSPLYALYSASQ